MKMLRARRKECGLTMKHLGELVGVSESAISQYETGKRQASYEVQLKLAEVLNCSIDYLLRGSEDEKIPTPVIRDGNDEEFIRLFSLLDAQAKKLIISQIKGILADRG